MQLEFRLSSDIWVAWLPHFSARGNAKAPYPKSLLLRVLQGSPAFPDLHHVALRTYLKKAFRRKCRQPWGSESGHDSYKEPSSYWQLHFLCLPALRQCPSHVVFWLHSWSSCPPLLPSSSFFLQSTKYIQAGLSCQEDSFFLPLWGTSMPRVFPGVRKYSFKIWFYP